MGSIDALVHRLFAEPAITDRRSRPRPLRIVRRQRHRIVLASKRPPHRRRKAAPQLAPANFSGRLYFARDGNIWSYDGATFRELTHSGDASDPSLTANGKKLAYVRRWAPPVSDIFTLNLQTHRITQITHDRTTDGDTSDNVWSYDPAYSPNGSTIMYTGDRYKLANAASDARQIDLALYSYSTATGATSAPLTAPSFGAGGDADPRFDPANPRQVLFTSYRYLPNATVSAQLTLLNLPTDTTISLTARNQQDMHPAWQPNGRYVAYVQNRGLGNRLLVAPFRRAHLLTRQAVQLDSGMVSMPAFSPDGRHLAYYNAVGNSFQLWVVDLSHGRPIHKPHMLLALPGLDPTSPIVWTR